MIDFKTWIDKKWDFQWFKKLFIEPRLDSGDSTSFLSFNSLIDKFSSEDLKKSFSNRLSEMQEMFLDGKPLWKYWLDFLINPAFKSDNFYLYWVLEEFLKDLKNEINWKAEFENQLKNINNFLSWDLNFFNFIKITEKHFNLNSQKIDLLKWLREDFKDSSFSFFWWSINWNFNFLKKIFEINSIGSLIKDNFPKINVVYPTWFNDLWWKHPEFHNFSLNKISEIISINKDKKIWIFTPSKTSLKDVYWFLLDNYPDLNLIWEGFSWWRNKVIHKLEVAEEWAVFIAQKILFEKVFSDTEFKFDIVIIFKMPFDPPGWIYKIRQNLVWWNFSNYAMPKSLLKVKQTVLASWASEVHFLDKRVWTEQWAKGFVEVLMEK